VADGEPGAQIYSAATKREQARIIHRAAIAVRDKSPWLRQVVKKYRDRLVVEETRSFFAPLGKDSKTEDGLNPHFAILDEIHAHVDSGMWDVLESGMGARRQPLIFAVTTAGYGVNTFGRRQDDYYRDVLDPRSGIANDNAFAYIAELERRSQCGRCRGKGCEACDGRGYRGDDPYDEAAWLKCCPNLGVSVSIDWMRARALKAKQHPPSEPEYLAKNTNLWVDVEDRWITVEQWDACGDRAAHVKREDLKGRPCFAGLDLASTTDTCAFIRYFPPHGPHKTPAVLANFWYPQERIRERRKTAQFYDEWIRAGYIKALGGSSVDQTFVFHDMVTALTEYPIQLLKYDPTDANMLATLLEGAGFRLEKCGQGYANYNAPTKELERIVFDGELAHFGNPVLRWMIGNVVLARNIDGDVMPAKGKSAEKIDGAAALIMAIGAAGTNPIQVSLPPVHHVVRKPGQGGGGPGRGGGGRAIFRAFK
jgi:phage terminase large subunit-like protein